MGRRLSIAQYSAFAVLTVALANACTSLLGIDGRYSPDKAASASDATGGKPSSMSTGGTAGADSTDATVGEGGSGGGGSPTVPDASAGGEPSGGGGSQPMGSGGEPAAGGRPSSGGAPSGGGTAGAASGGTPSTGGTPQTDSGAPVCPTGEYSGTYMGTHHPSSGGNVLPVNIAGSITLQFATASKTTLTVTGKLMFTLGMSGINGTARGTFDCSTGKGSVALLTGTTVTTVVPLFNGPIDGDFDMQVNDTGKLDGTFSIHESLSPSPAAVGSGTWSAD
jgi:hypothetical protein